MAKLVKGKPTTRQINDALKAEDVDDALGPVLPTYTVAGLPTASANNRRLVRCSNGNAGAACLALSDGTNWLRIALGAAVSAT